VLNAVLVGTPEWGLYHSAELLARAFGEDRTLRLDLGQRWDAQRGAFVGGDLSDHGGAILNAAAGLRAQKAMQAVHGAPPKKGTKAVPLLILLQNVHAATAANMTRLDLINSMLDSTTPRLPFAVDIGNGQQRTASLDLAGSLVWISYDISEDLAADAARHASEGRAGDGPLLASLRAHNAVERKRHSSTGQESTNEELAHAVAEAAAEAEPFDGRSYLRNKWTAMYEDRKAGRLAQSGVLREITPAAWSSRLSLVHPLEVLDRDQTVQWQYMALNNERCMDLPTWRMHHKDAPEESASQWDSAARAAAFGLGALGRALERALAALGGEPVRRALGPLPRWIEGLALALSQAEPLGMRFSAASLATALAMAAGLCLLLAPALLTVTLARCCRRGHTEAARKTVEQERVPLASGPIASPQPPEPEPIPEATPGRNRRGRSKGRGRYKPRAAKAQPDVASGSETEDAQTAEQKPASRKRSAGASSSRKGRRRGSSANATASEAETEAEKSEEETVVDHKQVEVETEAEAETTQPEPTPTQALRRSGRSRRPKQDVEIPESRTHSPSASGRPRRSGPRTPAA
jgi:hypothetical protein